MTKSRGDFPHGRVKYKQTETGKVKLLFYSRSFVLRQKASYGFAMKPFLCTICGKRRFATDYGRAEHQRALHGIRGIYFVPISA